MLKNLGAFVHMPESTWNVSTKWDELMDREKDG